MKAVNSSNALHTKILITMRVVQVDIATWGHVHQYERTCSMQNWKCVYKPTKNIDGIDTYSSSSYAGPIHVIIGMSGFRLDEFVDTVCMNDCFHDFYSLMDFHTIHISKEKSSMILLTGDENICSLNFLQVCLV